MKMDIYTHVVILNQIMLKYRQYSFVIQRTLYPFLWKCNQVPHLFIRDMINRIKNQ